MISESHVVSFEILKTAADDGRLALLECHDKTTGEPVMVVCATCLDGENYELIPLAKMFNKSPFQEVIPPDGVM